MSENIKLTGEVTEALPRGSFRVSLNLNEQSQDIIAHLSGKMRIHKIRITTGDAVEVEMTPYDLTKGRITRRL